MNQKIKQLATQAGWVETDDKWIHPYYKERGYLTSNDLEQFVRLIIAECHREISENSW